ncbi:MAG TPA: hypothetical protein VLW06_09015, partial [Terriglobales bacterium]|nr:hypothetical protein [Terriglobales bacterium]
MTSRSLSSIPLIPRRLLLGKPKLAQIEFIDKQVDHPNRIILANPIFQAFRKQRALRAVNSLNEAS